MTAAALALAILLYDAGGKLTPLGPPLMGTCRLLNVALGLSAASTAAAALPAAALVLPLALGLYTTLLTVLARGEVHGSSPGRVRTIVALVGGLGVLYVALVLGSSPAGFEPAALVFAAYLLVRGAAAFAEAARTPQPAFIRRAIGRGILLMPAIDATAVAASGHPLGAALVLIVAAPAHVLRRFFAMS
jgi:4-hydroxybenzoate polyprenyltransferase